MPILSRPRLAGSLFAAALAITAAPASAFTYNLSGTLTSALTDIADHDAAASYGLDSAHLVTFSGALNTADAIDRDLKYSAGDGLSGVDDIFGGAAGQSLSTSYIWSPAPDFSITLDGQALHADFIGVTQYIYANRDTGAYNSDAALSFVDVDKDIGVSVLIEDLHDHDDIRDLDFSGFEGAGDDEFETLLNAFMAKALSKTGSDALFFLVADLAGPAPVEISLSLDGSRVSFSTGAVSAVPLPATALLLPAALGALGFAGRRKRAA